MFTLLAIYLVGVALSLGMNTAIDKKHGEAVELEFDDPWYSWVGVGECIVWVLYKKSQ